MSQFSISYTGFFNYDASMDYFIGIDVGTGSARAGLFDETGKLLSNHSRSIRSWRPRPNFVEQSSEDIWGAICTCTEAVLNESGIAPESVKGLGFDATCSLVLIDAEGNPVTASPDGDDAQNIVVWMDHRALKETEFVNQAGDFPVYEFVGGKISPEMQAPKLLWLKKHLPESWQRTAHFFDLPDYLTYRATGALTRSLCSTTCKWTYLAHEAEAGHSGWQDDFFRAIELGDLVDEGYRRIGTEIRPMGQAVGQGLSAAAAKELGLIPGTAVGVSIIDAHAGGIGMIGMSEANGGPTPESLDNRLALIGGTSSCHMVASPEQRPISGVWGPYYSAMIPGLWLNEGGQSATGALVDHIIFNHGATEAMLKASREADITPYEVLNQKLAELAGEAPLHSLTKDLHVCPYFHGNRSPRANPNLVGMISGLHLSATLEDLALLYLATIQAIAYGTRHIIEVMNESGYCLDTLVCCGGGTKNPVFLQQHADITQCRLILPEEPEAVILGSAMLGAVASGAHKSVQSAMSAMSRPGKVITPEPDSKSYHNLKYKIFHKLYMDQQEYAATMQASTL
ncbi:FGGY-family carbohydrate kinase [Coraliomargarita parva]|uniref:FGGY-family carbohydrate kinase n=1 Tax=Coraliomargarita parva TaxID=3014050 RepID=UPI0022B3281F|nr:FGGY-family carbohydrate kinase [Coraliomargarita parva]